MRDIKNDHINIKTIAKYFNISTATVSKALNNRQGVSDELRGRICKYAEQMNYVPDPMGQGLKGKNLKTIGVVITDIANPFYANSVQSITDEAEKRGYNVFLCDSQESCSKEAKQIDDLIRRKVNGLIIVPASYSCDNMLCRKQYERLNNMQVPFVFLQRTVEDPEGIYDYVKCDNALGTYLAMQYLFDTGHKNIAYFTAVSTSSSTKERYEGVIEVCLKNGVTDPGKNIFTCDSPSYEKAFEKMLKILNEKKAVSAVFCANDMMAFGAINAIRFKGLQVPRDIAVVGYDDNFYAQMFSPKLTTVHQETLYMAKRSATLLFEKIEGKITRKFHEIVAPVLVKRETA